MTSNINQLFEELPDEMKKVKEIQDAEQLYREASSNARRIIEAVRKAVATPFTATEHKKLEALGCIYYKEQEHFKINHVTISRGSTDFYFKVEAENAPLEHDFEDLELEEVTEFIKEYNETTKILEDFRQYRAPERVAIADYFKQYEQYEIPYYDEDYVYDHLDD